MMKYLGQFISMVCVGAGMCTKVHEQRLPRARSQHARLVSSHSLTMLPHFDFQVNVFNDLPATYPTTSGGISIHWHGLSQRSSPWCVGCWRRDLRVL